MSKIKGCGFVISLITDGEEWTSAEIAPAGGFVIPPQSAGTMLGATISQTVRLSGALDGKIAAFGFENAAARISLAAAEFGLPALDEQLPAEAFISLVERERGFLQDGAPFARIELCRTDGGDDTPRGLVSISLYKAEQKRELCAASAVISHELSALLQNAGSPAQQGALCLMRQKASQKGAEEMIALDPVYRRYILRACGGALFARLGDSVIMPKGLSPDFTARCARELFCGWGIEPENRPLSLDELLSAYEKGELKELFCVGEREPVSAVTKIITRDKKLEIPQGKLAKKLFDTIGNMESGALLPPSGWVKRI